VSEAGVVLRFVVNRVDTLSVLDAIVGLHLSPGACQVCVCGRCSVLKVWLSVELPMGSPSGMPSVMSTRSLLSESEMGGEATECPVDLLRDASFYMHRALLAYSWAALKPSNDDGASDSGSADVR
jgi:hypothetical protein